MAKYVIEWANHFPNQYPEKNVLMNLADNSDQYGRVKFSLSGLASECSLTLDEVKNCIDELGRKRLMVFNSKISSITIDKFQDAILLINQNIRGV